MSKDPFNQNADAFLSGGAPAQKFPREGFEWGGTIESWEMAQQTHMETGELLFWANGKPRMQLIISMMGEPTGITWETNAYKQVVLPDDDGSRRLFVKGGLQKAVSKAMRDAKATGLEVGAYLKIKRTTDLPPKQRGFSGTHTFSAVWTPASQNPHAASALLAQDDDEAPF